MSFSLRCNLFIYHVLLYSLLRPFRSFSDSTGFLPLGAGKPGFAFSCGFTWGLPPIGAGEPAGFPFSCCFTWGLPPIGASEPAGFPFSCCFTWGLPPIGAGEPAGFPFSEGHTCRIVDFPSFSVRGVATLFTGSVSVMDPLFRRIYPDPLYTDATLLVVSLKCP